LPFLAVLGRILAPKAALARRNILTFTNITSLRGNTLLNLSEQDALATPILSQNNIDFV